jgi:hypothetical protein
MTRRFHLLFALSLGFVQACGFNPTPEQGVSDASGGAVGSGGTGGSGGAAGGTVGSRSDAGMDAASKLPDALVRLDATGARDLPPLSDAFDVAVIPSADAPILSDGAGSGDLLPLSDTRPFSDVPPDTLTVDAPAVTDAEIVHLDARAVDIGPSCPTSCDDGLSCTTDSCVAGACQNTVQAGSCVIDKICYADGDANASDPCKACVAATSTNAWSSLPEGSKCGTSKSCQAGACSACGGVGQACCGTGASATCVSGAMCNAGTNRCEIDKAISISGANDTFCALFQSGRVRCWGGGSAGLGDGSSGASNVVAPPVSGLSDATQISVGGNGACAVRATGAVVCWGKPTPLSSISKTPTAVSAVSDAEEVSIGWDHACVRTAQGKVLCWGNNGSGQLGDGTQIDSAIPVELQGVSNARQVAAGYYATCVLRDAGKVSCVGEARINGQIQTTTTVRDLQSPADASSLASSIEGDFCALLTSGGVSCWGRWNGEPAAALQGAGQPIFVAAGVGQVTNLPPVSVVQQDGALWVMNTMSPLGTGIRTPINPPSYANAILLGETGPASNVIAAVLASRASCLLRTDGSVCCAGKGNLGDGQLIDRPAFRNYFVPVVGILPVASEAGQCSDGIDNDGNGKTDLDDPACAVDIGSAIGNSVVSAAFSTVYGNYLRVGCNPSEYAAPEVFLTWTAPVGGTYQFETAGSEFDTVLAAYKGYPAVGAELVCNDDKPGVTDGSSSIQVKVATGDKLMLVVDSKAGFENVVSYSLNITKQ